MTFPAIAPVVVSVRLCHEARVGAWFTPDRGDVDRDGDVVGSTVAVADGHGEGVGRGAVLAFGVRAPRRERRRSGCR